MRRARRLQGKAVKSGSSMFFLLARAFALIKGPTSDTLDRRDLDPYDGSRNMLISIPEVNSEALGELIDCFKAVFEFI